MIEPMAEVRPEAGDARRAAVLLRHYLSDDPDGLVVVLEEAQTAGRMLELILSSQQLIVALVPEMRADTGRAWLQAAINALAEQENAPPGFTSLREW